MKFYVETPGGDEIAECPSIESVKTAARTTMLDDWGGDPDQPYQLDVYVEDGKECLRIGFIRYSEVGRGITYHYDDQTKRYWENGKR